ncbi:MAG: hypothetical protein FJ024_00960, partial [Chloroflexi bacterium]|nr:hypothetical protein [Chloroflexota bacterium]
MMKVSGFGWFHGMKGSLRLCLCIVLVGVTIASAILCSVPGATTGKLSPVQVCQAAPLEPYSVDYVPMAAAGSLPEIKMFKATPMVLSGSESALYKFVVRRATKVVIVEAGNFIKEISNPAGATLDGTANGLPANTIPTGSGNTFMAYCFAYNGAGQAQAELTLTIETEPTGQPSGQTGVADNQTKGRSPKWLDQYSSPFSAARSSMSGTEPKFFDCPSDCDYCLKPEEAASQGMNQKCSEERCYYSPDNQQNWYCYKQAPGWCCKDGKVFQSSKEECDKAGGQLWFFTQAEALQRCQPGGWCCKDGKIFQSTKEECAKMGGSTWFLTQAEAAQRCQPGGWCCRDGKVFPGTKEECDKMGGSSWYLTQAEALQRCQPGGWCCKDGKVGPLTKDDCTRIGGLWFLTQAEALQRCQPQTCWCCLRGQVFQTTQSQCIQSGGACYSTQAEALQRCQPQTCWCCLRGQVFQTTQSQCIQSGGACYSTQ